ASGVRNWIDTPKLAVLEASEVKVRTTPLTCGCQASVAMSTRISGLRRYGEAVAVPRPCTAIGGRSSRLMKRAHVEQRGGGARRRIFRIACDNNFQFASHLYYSRPSRQRGAVFMSVYCPRQRSLCGDESPAHVKCHWGQCNCGSGCRRSAATSELGHNWSRARSSALSLRPKMISKTFSARHFFEETAQLYVARGSRLIW